MALVQLSDAIIPVVYRSYQDVLNPKLTAFFDSGIIVQDPMMADALASNTGYDVTVPAWGDLDPSIEPNYITDNPADVAVPLKLGSLQWKMRKAFLDQAWSAADLVRELAGSDPMQAIRRRTDKYWQRRLQLRIISTLLGVYNANVASNGGDMVVNIASGAGVAPTSTNQFNRNSFIDSQFTLGEHFDDMVGMLLHPTVYANLRKADLIQYTEPSQLGLKMPTYDGKLVFIDNQLPFFAATGSGGTLVAARYMSIFFGLGALGFAEGAAGIPVETYRQPLQGNGGGVDILIERKAWMLHPRGHNFTSNTVTGNISALNSDLQVAANWTRVEYHENIKLAFMLSNG